MGTGIDPGRNRTSRQRPHRGLIYAAITRRAMVVGGIQLLCMVNDRFGVIHTLLGASTRTSMQSMCMPPTIQLLFFGYSDYLIHPPGAGFCASKMHICTANSQRFTLGIIKQTASPDLLPGEWIHFRNPVGYDLHLLSLPFSGSPGISFSAMPVQFWIFSPTIL